MAGDRECVWEARHHCDDISLKTELDQRLIDRAGEDAAAGGHDVPARRIALERYAAVEQMMPNPCHADEPVTEDELRANLGGEGAKHAEFEVDLAITLSAVSVLETVLGFSGREDFWIIAAIQERR